MIRRALLAAALLTGAAHAQIAPPRDRTLVVAQTFDPISLWPNATTASDNINAGAAVVESLFWGNPATGKIEPLLGESYTQVDPTTVRIVLRRGVTFTNGEPMDADAAVASSSRAWRRALVLSGEPVIMRESSTTRSVESSWRIVVEVISPSSSLETASCTSA